MRVFNGKIHVYDVTCFFCLLYFRGFGKQGYQCQGEKDTSHVINRIYTYVLACRIHRACVCLSVCVLVCYYLLYFPYLFVLYFCFYTCMQVVTPEKLNKFF